MEKLMQELKRKGLFPENGTLQEFVKQYGNKDALTSLHTDLVSKKILDESIADFDSFVTGFELSEVVNPTPLGGDDPFRNEFAENIPLTVASPASIASDQSKNLEEWYESAIASLTVNGVKIPNYDAQLKRIDEEYQKARYDQSVVNYDNYAQQNIIPYLGTDTSNPMVDVSDPSEILSQEEAGKEFVPGGQAQLEDKYNRQTRDPEAGPQTGIHSWMFTESNVNLKKFGAPSEQGVKDSEYKLANKLWTISEELGGSIDNTLIPVLERQYPDYKFNLKHGQYKEVKAVDGFINNVLGTEIEVVAPNGEKTNIYGGIKGRGLTSDTDIQKAITDQKVKLANFINTHGIDLKAVRYSIQNTAQKYNDLLAKPYNEKDISKGGIGLDNNQQFQAAKYGTGEYVEDPNGNINYKFVYNPALFHDNSYEDYIQKNGKSLVEENVLTSEDLKNTDDENVKSKVKDYILKEHGVWKFSENERGNRTSERVFPRGAFYDRFRNVIHDIEYGDEYMQFAKGNTAWKNTVKALAPAYNAAGVELTDEIIKTHIAQKEHEEYVNGAIDANLNEYLWKADNDNRSQALYSVASIVTRDIKLNEAMALQGLNEAAIVNYNKFTPDLGIVDFFEETYNNPKASFSIEGLDAKDITTLRNGKQVSTKDFNNYIAAKSRRNNQMEAMLKRRSKAWELQDEVGNIDANIKLLEKDYNIWNYSVATLGLGFSDIGTGLLYLGGKISKYTSPIVGTSYWTGRAINAFTDEGNFLTEFWDEWDKEWADKYDDYSLWKEGIKSQYGREVSFHRDKFGRGGAFSPGNFGRFVAQETSKQIPILTTMIASGGTAAPWVIGAYSAGQHWADADRREYITGEVENEFVQGMKSIGYGAAEGVFERLTTIPILKRGGKLIQQMGEPSMLSYRNAMKQYFKENTLFLASSPIAEASAEFGTQITQNAIDGRPIMENVDHAAFVGGMFGHAMSVTPFMSGLVARQFSDYNSFSEYKKRQQEINELEQELVYETNQFAIPQDLGNLKMKQKVIDDLKAEQKAFVEEKFSAIQNTMTNSAYNQFETALAEQADISEVVNDMLSKDNANSNNKLLNVYKKRFDNLQFKRDVWRSAENFSNKFTLLETTNKERYDQTIKKAKAQLAKDNVGDIRDDQVLPLAEEIYVGELIDENFEAVSKNKSNKNKRYLKFDTNGEALTYIEDVLATSKEKINARKDLTDEQKATRIVDLERQIRDVKDNVNKKETKGAITSLLEGRLSGWNMTFDADGILTTDPAAIKRSEVLGFRENAIRNNETQIFTHEAGHDTFGELLGYDSMAFKPLAGEIVSYMQKNHPMLLKGLALKRGSELKKADEIVMNFLELVGNKTINIQDKQGGLLSTSFGFITNNIFKSNNKPTMEFNGQNGAIKFLNELGTAVSEGRVTPEMIAKWKREGVIQGAKKKYQKAQRVYKRLIEEIAVQELDKNIKEYKFSDTKDIEDANKIMQELQALVADNKVTPVKNYEQKKAALSARFKALKEKASVVEKVPVFQGNIKDETDAARKERVNLIERSFRGKLETAQGGKPMSEILRAYEGKIEALFKKGGYFATDSYQRFENIAEALEEFTAITKIELMKSIRAFKPDVNKDFDAYIMSPKILPNKVKLANKIIGKESKNKGFDVGLEAASGVAVSEDTTLQEFETTLREVLGIKKGDPVYEAAMTAVQDVMQKGLPKFEYTQRKKTGKGETVTLAQVRKVLNTNPTGEVKRQAERDLAGIMKKVKSELEASYQEALDKTIKKEFLKAKVYDSFLKEHRTELLKRLPIEDLVALERLVKPDSKIFTSPVVMDKQTGRTVLNPTEVKQYEGSGNLTTATTTQGPTLYNRKNPSEKQFVDFFNVRGRKNALAKILSGYLGLDATMQNLTSEKVVNEIAKGNPQIKEQLGEQALKDIALSIGRGTAFKFSMAEDVGMEGKLAEDYNKLQPEIIEQIIDMDVSDPMSVNLAVDVVLSNRKFAPYRSAIKKNFLRYLKPYAKAIDLPGEIEIQVMDYITREIDRIEEDSIQLMWNSKPMAQAFANIYDVQNQKQFDNRVTQQTLLNKAGTDSKGNQNEVTEDIKIDLAALELRYMSRIQSGVEVVSKKARNMLYRDVDQWKREFLQPNFGFTDYKYFTRKDKNTGKSTRYLEFTREDGTRTEPIVYPASPAQEVKTNMIDGSMSQAEIDFRERMADEAWNFVVDKYKAAKEVVENDSADELNIAMMMAGMGSMMTGPIRAAAPYRYRPLDVNVTELRKGEGKFKNGIFTTKQSDLVSRIRNRVNNELGLKVNYTTAKNGDIEIDFKNESASNLKAIKNIIKEETAKNFEYEHGIPAKIVNLLIADAVFNPDSKVDLQKLKDSYAVGAIPVDMNENFSTFFGDRMLDTYEVGDIAPTRWYNEYTRGRPSYAVEDVRTKERFGEKEAQLWKEQQQAANANKFSLSNNVVDMNNLTADEILDYAATVDEALRIARDPNAPVKKIRVFDFDDTLARTKSGVKYTMPNETGKPQPGRKAILLVGSAGSGKTTIVNDLGLRKQGYKYINQDVALDWLSKNAGLPKDMNEFTDEEVSKWRDLQFEAAEAAKTKATRLQGEGSGVVIDATGSSDVGFETTARELADAGYDTHIIFVDSSLDTALKRNKARGERKLTDTTVKNSYEAVQKNKKGFKEYTSRMVMGKPLAKGFTEINTDNIQKGDPLPIEFVNEIDNFTSGHIKGRLTAEEFAKQGTDLLEQGAEFDFSEFNKVMEGEKGPLLDVAKAIQEARGTQDVFVLTARASAAAPAIKEFLESVGLNIPLSNITGLGNSSPFAKSRWIVEKAAQGYNDFYFADDHTGNVKAVEDALSVIDVKSKVQQAKFKFSETVDEDFNKILEDSTGIEWFKEFSKAKGELLGKQNQTRKLHPYSAEDFEGMIYPLLGKGKKGDANYKWFEDHLFKPFSRAMSDLATARINLMDDFRALKKTLVAPKTIKKTNSTGFNNENSVRVYIWNKLGKDIPGLSKTDLKEINNEIENNPELKLFAEEIIKINKGDYKDPGKNWLAGTISTDLYEGLNTIKRKEFLKEWKENVDIIFSEKNLNKLEAAFGPKYIEALKNILQRMESGSNRLYSNNRLTNQVLDYLNNAQGVVMFLNMRSALLQGISSVNFLNWSFNNPVKAGVAFGNMPQYSKDFVELMNSDYLVNRRGGLSMDLQADEVANSAKTSKNKAKAIVSYIIEKGYAPTKFMDSFAIASGGATFYRNRINDLVKKGLSEKEARNQAYQEFVEIAEKNQQSSRPDKISSQQASTLGRITLNWANTQMQYVRIQKKAIQDIANGRGDIKTNISRIVYYGVIQNLWFQMAHSAMFALAFGEDDDDPKFKEDKIERTVNGAADNILRGLGIGGHVFSVLKNMGIKLYKEGDKQRSRYSDQLWELFKLSPVISSKVNRLKQAAWQFDSKKRRQEMIDKGFALDNPAYEASAKVISAITNVPIDRLLLKMQNIGAAMSEETETWMDIALLLGWPEWTLDAPKKETSNWGPTKTEKKSTWRSSGYKKEKTWGPQK